jgi:hypothetical protein
VRAGLWLAALAALAMLAPGRAAAQEFLDQGVFLISRDGAEIGREEFAIQATPGRQGRPGVRAVATDRYREREVQAALDLTDDHRPVAYQADVTVGGRLTERLSGQLARGRFAERVVSPTGEVVREFAVPADVVVLDDDGFDQFYFVPRPASEGSLTLNLIRPRDKAVVTGEVRTLGLDTVVVGSRGVPAQHYGLTLPGGDTREFWFSLSGSLLKVAVPSRSIVAIRASLPIR